MLTFSQYLSEKMYTPSANSDSAVRRAMPQIDTKNFQKFFDYLRTEHNISIKLRTEDPKKLKPSQNQFSQQKIQDMIADIERKKYIPSPILVSSDDYVMDGHHRWLAHYNTNSRILIVRIDCEKDQLIDIMHQFPLSYKKKLHEDTIENDILLVLDESGTVCPAISKTHMDAFETLVDKLFKKFKIDFDFSKHFRERMSDERNRPCITLKDLGLMIQKIYKKKTEGKDPISKHKDAEIVIKDMQTDLNMPVAIEYDRQKDEIRVGAKTIMRKKDFITPNPIERV